MGYYSGRRDRPCPRCGAVVATLFISVGPMSFSQRCLGCGTTEFTADEEARLGDNVLPTVGPERITEDDGSTTERIPDMEG